MQVIDDVQIVASLVAKPYNLGEEGRELFKDLHLVQLIIDLHALLVEIVRSVLAGVLRIEPLQTASPRRVQQRAI